MGQGEWWTPSLYIYFYCGELLLCFQIRQKSFNNNKRVDKIEDIWYLLVGVEAIMLGTSLIKGHSSHLKRKQLWCLGMPRYKARSNLFSLTKIN